MFWLIYIFLNFELKDKTYPACNLMQVVYMYIDCRTLHLYLVWLKRENAKHEYLSVSYRPI